jgi:hypothetical protein
MRTDPQAWLCGRDDNLIKKLLAGIKDPGQLVRQLIVRGCSPELAVRGGFLGIVAGCALLEDVD